VEEVESVVVVAAAGVVEEEAGVEEAVAEAEPVAPEPEAAG
jgi:hypothetical protein